ncbi:hypothetical protein PENSPDRAFT_754044 [Peniophora sp. CONT]|nr:hypothetical protein PENSPDRAFT_754044 [Peniophora sp. CONT]
MSVVEAESEAGAIPVRPVRSPLRSQSRPRPPQGLSMLALNTTPSSSDFTDEMLAALPMPTSATTIDFGKPSASSSTVVLPARASLPNMASSSTASTSEPTPVPTTKAKRVHALLELLSSERAYASDLSLVRELHIPAARGHLTGPPPPTPPASSGSSARTASMASNDSSFLEHGPAMTQEDVRQVFGNIAEVALFADTFVDRIEDALGNVLDGGVGADRVGALFLDIIPMMEPPYAVYISHHTRALSYLESLPRTPALAAYLAHTRASAASFSHAWDLPSLLIKPVQRLLKYPLLLHAILQDTPPSHPDYDALVQAKARIERVAHAVNEQQRRRQVVAAILAEPPQALQIRKRTLLARTHSSKGRPGTAADKDDELEGDDSESAERLRAMETELRAALDLFDKLADAADAWAASCTAATRTLSVWAHAFGALLGLDPPPLPASDEDSVRSHNGVDDEEPNDAYGAFLALVDKRLAALSHDAASLVAEQLRPNLIKLKTVASQPLTLLNALHALQPAHAAVLAHPASKGKQDKQLLEHASQYAALRAQLLDELPAALALSRAGASACAAAAVRWHTLWFAGARAGWGALWESLRLPEEATARGREETEAVWRIRAADAHASLTGLKSLRPPVAVAPARRDSAGSQRSADAEKGVRALVAASMFNALEPAAPGRAPSIAERDRERERETGKERGWRRVVRRRSDDSLKSAASKSSNEDGPLNTSSSIGFGFGSSFAFASPSASSFTSPSGSYRSAEARRQSVPPAHASIPEMDEGTLSRHATDGHRATPGASTSTTRPSTARTRTYTGEDRGRDGKDKERDKDRDSKDSKRGRAAAFLDAVRPAAMVRRSSSRKRDSSPGPFIATEAPLDSASTSIFPDADVPIDRDESFAYIRREESRGKLVPNRPDSAGGVLPAPLRPNRRRDSNGRDTQAQRPSTAGAGSQHHEHYDYDRERERERERHSGHEYPYVHDERLSSQIPHSASQPTLRPTQRDSSLSGLPSSASASVTAMNGAGPSGLSPPPIPRRADTRGDPSHFGSGGGSRGGSGSSNGARAPSPRVSSKWLTQPPRYVVTAVHSCTPPAAALYCGLPFFSLKRGDAFEVLREAGHPRAHRERGIPLWVEEGGDDCLLLVRKPGRDGAKGELGWALASFMWPVD